MFKAHATAAALAAAVVTVVPQAANQTRRITFADLSGAAQRRFVANGVGEYEFDAYLSRIAADTDRRVAEGEREHLIHYALQSTRFTDRAPIEPALSARRFVEQLPAGERSRLLDDPAFMPDSGWPAAERDRVADLIEAFDHRASDARVGYFRQLLGGGKTPRIADLFRDYVRVARFLYLKEWVPAASPSDVARVVRLYQTRPHSSDTQVEAGFGVYLGLGVVRDLESNAPRALNNVLIVGPGMDLAPRTDLIDVVPPQSYQPFAVADALLALSLASDANLRLYSADVNPRVVSFLDSMRRDPLTIHWFSGTSETADRPISDDYATYERSLGLAIGEPVRAPHAIASAPRHLRSIAVRPAVTRGMTAGQLNIITERLVDWPAFDLIVATNVLTYFDDDQLVLALSNVAAMLRPDGYFIHNESRSGLAETASSSKLPIVHMRTAVIGGPAGRPLYDAVWLHRKAH